MSGVTREEVLELVTHARQYPQRREFQEPDRLRAHVRWLTASGISEEEIADWMHTTVHHVRSIKAELAA